MARESYVFVYMPGSGFEKGPAATVLPSLWGKVSDGNLLSTTFVTKKVQPATFVWSNVMMAIFAQSNGAAEADRR